MGDWGGDARDLGPQAPLQFDCEGDHDPEELEGRSCGATGDTQKAVRAHAAEEGVCKGHPEQVQETPGAEGGVTNQPGRGCCRLISFTHVLCTYLAKKAPRSTDDPWTLSCQIIVSRGTN